MNLIITKRQEFCANLSHIYRIEYVKKKRQVAITQDDKDKDIIQLEHDKLFATFLYDVKQQLWYNTDDYTPRLTRLAEQAQFFDPLDLPENFSQLVEYFNLRIQQDSFLNMLELMLVYSQKQLNFCDQFLRSQLYYEIVIQLVKYPIDHQVEVIQFIEAIQSTFPHNVLVTPFEETLQYHCKNSDIIHLKPQLKKIIHYTIKILIENPNYQIRDTQRLILAINQFLLTLLAITRDDLFIQSEILCYLHFISSKQNLYDQSCIDLIDILAFELDSQKYEEETCAALRVIGLLVSGNSTITSYYMQKFSKKGMDLIQKLVVKLKDQSHEIRRQATFSLSNIFGDESINILEYCQNGLLQFIIQQYKDEENPSVISEYLVLFRNIIYESNYEIICQYFPLDFLLLLIFKSESMADWGIQILCLRHLGHKFEGLSQEQCHQLINYNSIYQFLFDKGVLFQIQAIYFNDKNKLGQQAEQCCKYLLDQLNQYI
ncbi:hypothetical protein pb186bvf_007708 [Paramecium bursaria]